jgi:LPXTG-motif cell wall-anchored protein
VSGTIVVGSLFQPFEFTLDGGPGADTVAPTFVQNPLPDLTFRAALPASSNPQGRVNYVLPQATDNRPGTPSVVCTPASGTMFRAGRTPVTCVASDAAGNRRERSFDVILINETVPVLAGFLPGEQITATATDMAPSFPVRATIFSEPVDVGEFMPDADGMVTVTVTVPDGLPVGEHQLVLTGRTADGNLNSVGFPFTVLDPAAVPTIPTPTGPPAVDPPVVGTPPSPADPVVAPFRPAPAQTPVGGLPATGSDGVNRIVVLGATLAALGLLLWLASRRRVRIR